MEHFHIENLSFTYPEKEQPALKDINLTVNKGEYVVICGRSGCGKTTLLKCLKPVLTPYGKTTGAIYFNQKNVNTLDKYIQAKSIGYVMQMPEEQIVTDKVWHELAFGLECIGAEPNIIRARVAEMACYFGIQDWFERDVATLSGGQKQLLNLASVLALQPEVLILDEPTSQLDPLSASDFLNTVKKINTELGTTIIITEHRLEDIFPYADRAIVMDKGQIIVDAPPIKAGRLLFEKQHPMLNAMPAPMRIFKGDKENAACPLTVREARDYLSERFQNGARVTELANISRPAVKDYAIEFKDVYFRYEKKSADILKGLNLKIPRGSFYAIVGANGAGKSTALKTACGICRHYRGTVKIFNKPIGSYKQADLFKNCLAMLPQEPADLFVKNTVLDDLLEITDNRESINRAASLCQIEGILQSHPLDLSGGELQRAALAKILLTEPKAVLLDEPTKGLDGFFKIQFAKIIDMLKGEGITVIMVSHDVEFCASYADYVGMFFSGDIVCCSPPKEFFSNNSFYTTSASRLSRHIFNGAVTAGDVIELIKINTEEKL